LNPIGSASNIRMALFPILLIAFIYLYWF